MKKKIFLAVIAIFVICLTCGMLFVACNEKEDDNGGKKPGDITIETTAGDVFAAVVNEFGAVADGTSKEYNVALEIVAGDTPVFTLAFEQNEGKDYIYAAVGNEFVKINGFDVGGVVVEVLNWLVGRDGTIAGMVPVNAAGFNESVGSLLAEMNILSSSCEADDDAYRVGLNMSSIAGLLSGLNVDGKIAEAGLSGIIDPIVGALFDLLKIDLGADVKPSVGALIDYIGENVDVNAYFGFNDDAADTSAEPFGKFDISKKIAAARKLPAINALNISTQIKIDALDIETPAEPETPDEGGTAAEPTRNTSYVLDIDIDLDPFVLVRKYGEYEFGILSMIGKEGYLMEDGFKLFIDDKKFSMDTIMDMVADAGYLHISLDEVAIEASEGVAVGDVVKNLFTLHFNSEEGKVIASASVVNEVGLEPVVELAPYSIGGVYEMEALTTVIDMLINPDKYTGSGAAEGEAEVKPCEDGKHVDTDPADCKCDKCGTAIAHVDKEPLDNKCDVCGAHVHGDRNPVDGVCDTEGCNEHLHYDKNKDGICDTANCKHIMNVMTLITTIFNDVKNTDNGFYAPAYDENEKLTSATVNFEKLANYVVKKFVTLPEGDSKWELINKMIEVLPGQVLGGNALRVNLAGIPFEYGKLTEKDRVATEKLVYNLREDESLTGTNDNMYMETVTGVTAKEGTDIAAGSLVTVTGTAFDGETTITTSGIIMAVDGDTYYVGILTDFYANYDAAEAIVNGLIGEADKKIDLSTLIKPNWPFYGVLAYTPAPAQA